MGVVGGGAALKTEIFQIKEQTLSLYVGTVGGHTCKHSRKVQVLYSIPVCL